MRLAGIPARVVTGYLGGEYNEMGRFFLVRQADAHAWCEVWIEDVGWQRVDPTSVVAPDRVNLGLNSFLKSRAAFDQTNEFDQNGFVRTLTRWSFVTKTRLAWQTLNYVWDTNVLSFDGDAQASFLSSMGINRRDPIALLLTVLTGALIFLVLYAAWTRWRSQPAGDRVETLYRRFCDKAARLGVPRLPAEGPLNFTRRAGLSLPNEALRIDRIGKAYIALRYSGENDFALAEELARDVRLFFSSARRQPSGN
jgi:hypothetical protein